uniref:Uncharacterized protein n=1 Tax=Anguilla anguilla TaxID=7936 RepID=A0A0E9TJZ7_ANGAN
MNREEVPLSENLTELGGVINHN